MRAVFLSLLLSTTTTGLLLRGCCDGFDRNDVDVDDDDDSFCWVATLDSLLTSRLPGGCE